MIELLTDALKELGAENLKESEDRQSLLTKLQKEEDLNYRNFSLGGVPPSGMAFMDDELTKEVNRTLIFKEPVMCHTGLLPAKTRYLGILTEMKNSSFDHFDQGITLQQAESGSVDFDKTLMPLVQEKPNSRAQLETCGTTVDIDTKNYFYVPHQEMESKLILPNKLEAQVYLNGIAPLKGIVIMCLSACAWGKCEKGDMREDDFASGNATMTVNGDRVSNYTKAEGCLFLRSERGYFWTPNDQGQYEIAVKVHLPKSYVRISAIILI